MQKVNERHDKIFEESQGGVTTVRTGPQGTKLVYQFWDPSRHSRGGVGYKAARSLEDALNKWKAAGSISPPSASVRPPAHRAPAPNEAEQKALEDAEAVFGDVSSLLMAANSGSVPGCAVKRLSAAGGGGKKRKRSQAGNCEHCDKQLLDLARHQRRGCRALLGSAAAEERRAACPHCSVEVLPSYLEEHRRRFCSALLGSAEERRVACPDCGVGVVPTYLEKHRRGFCSALLGSIEERRVACPDCDVEVVPSYLEQHRRRFCSALLGSAEERRVACPDCGVGVVPTYLEQHRRRSCSALLGSIEQRRTCTCTEPGCEALMLPASLPRHIDRVHRSPEDCRECGGCGKPFEGYGFKNPSLFDTPNICATCSRRDSRLCSPTARHGSKTVSLYTPRSEYLSRNVPWPGNSSHYYCVVCDREGELVCAGFDGPPDAAGRSAPHQLCSKHAVEAGTKSSHRAGASHAACEALHVLAKQEGLVVLRHVHFEVGEEPEGWEAGILADHPRIKVDAVCRRASDGALVAYQFHGNRFHGFPAGNPLHETFGVGHQWGPALCNKTRRRTEQYIKGPHLGLDGTTRPEGYVVVEVWEHDYISYKQQVKAAPRGGEVSAPPTLAFTQHAHDPDLDMSEAAMASRDVPVDTMPAGDHVRSKQARVCASLSALSAAGDGRVAVNLAVATGGPCPLCRQTNSAAKAAAKAEAASV